MNLAALDLNLLLAFEAIYRERSVSVAALRLGLAQPRLSAALGRLRRAFGDELFVRAAGAMQPTPKALRLAPGIAAALDQLRDTLTGAAPFSPGEAQRSFVMASTDYTTLVLVPSIVKTLRAQAPHVDLRILGYDKDDVPAMVDRGEIDVALGVFRDPPPRAVCQMLCPERFVGLARRGHPALEAGAMTLSAYAAADHALVTVRRDAVGEIDGALEGLGLARRIALVLPHMLALPAILARGDLVAALPERAATAIAGPDLVVFELPLPLASWRIEMLWNAAARADAASAWLRAIVAAAAGATRGRR